jgi:hypothetical protein
MCAAAAEASSPVEEVRTQRTRSFVDRVSGEQRSQADASAVDTLP